MVEPSSFRVRASALTDPPGLADTPGTLLALDKGFTSSFIRLDTRTAARRCPTSMELRLVPVEKVLDHLRQSQGLCAGRGALPPLLGTGL